MLEKAAEKSTLDAQPLKGIRLRRICGIAEAMP